jgi:hypothetical protein
MLVTLSGMVTPARLEQSRNAWSPMLVTLPVTSGIEDGIVTAPPGPLYPVMVIAARLKP